MTTINSLSQELSKLGITIIAGEEYCDKNLTYITIMELPEKTNRFKINGLVLSTFSSFKDEEEIIDQIKWLQHVGIIGIGFHKAHYKEVPPAIAQYAKTIGMPLLEIPVDIPYHKILDIFNQAENKDLNLKTHEIHKVNEKIMEAVLSEKSNGYIINLIGNYIKKNIILLDMYLKVRAVWKEPSLSQDEMDHLTASLTSVHKQSLLQTRFFKRESNLEVQRKDGTAESLIIIPLTSKGSFYGYLIVDDSILNDFYNNEIVRYGIKAITLGTNHSVATDQHLKVKDIKKLEAVLNDTENISSDHFYIKIEHLKRCVLISFNSDKLMQEAFKSLNEILMEKKTSSLTWIFEGNLIVFIEHQNEIKEIQELAGLLQNEYIGMSSEHSNPSLIDIKQMYLQAKTSLKYSQMKTLNSSSWNEIGVERVAYNISGQALFKSLDTDILGGLLEYDAQKDGSLLITLESCLKHFFNLKAVGKELFIHPNTVKYRIGQIKELINIDIYDYSNFALLVVALKIYKRNN